MRASVSSWLRSTVTPGVIDDAINDAVSTEFMALLKASLSILMGGPTNVTLTAASERTTLTSLTDPAVLLTITDTVSGALAQHTVIAGYTLVTASGTETLISGTTTRVVAANNVADVAAPAFVADAIGWNCYAGATANRLCKQNTEPIPFGTDFIEDDAGISNNPDDPLPPTQNTTGDNIFYIRHMEVLTSSAVLKSWNQGDIDSDMMRRLGLTIPASSEYQNYGFDLINQRQLEIRPALGSTLTARYFYIIKPRKMKFDGSPLPFPTVPDEKFIRCSALSDVFLSLREYKASEMWEKKAAQELSMCVQAVVAMNRPKNQRVTPYRT